jgi:hypothetical protein
MDTSTLIFLIVGVPAILVALGFVALCLRWLLKRDQRADHGKLLEAARQLDARLATLEVRLTALEDILMGGSAPGGQPQDPKLRGFDAELNRS